MALKHLPDLLDFGEFEDANQMLVCILLYYRADRRGLIRGSQSDIARECNLSPRTVTRVIRRLLELGLLDYFSHGRYGLPGHAPNQVTQAKTAPPPVKVPQATHHDDPNEVELARLEATRREWEATDRIFVNSEGWPLLIPKPHRVHSASVTAE